MKQVEEDARRTTDFPGPRHGERREQDGSEAVCNDFTAAGEAEDEDERALRLARAWREGKSNVWAWWVDCLNACLASGRTYASMRGLTDATGQRMDFVDDAGAKVAVPHDRGLGRGLALLMAQEHPEFRSLLRMQRRRGREEA